MEEAQRAAIDELEQYLRTSGWLERRLQRAFVQARYQTPEAVAGWRVCIPIGRGTDSAESLDILVRRGYPLNIPVVGLPGPPKVLEWPHVEPGNTLCTVSGHEAASVNIANPLEVAEVVLRRAVQLLQDLRSGGLRQDFVNEWATYWNLALQRGQSIYATFPPGPPSRTISVFRAARNMGGALFAGARDQLAVWVAHLTAARAHGAELRKLKEQFVDGMFLWLPQPLYPDDFPRSYQDFANLVASAGMDGQLPATADELYPVLFGFDTGINGATIGALNVVQNTHSIGRLQRNLAGPPVVRRTEAKRADPEWIHTRGGAGLMGLDNCSVVIVGCGSLGADAAMLIARSGVGRITLIDDDVLSWDNVGRYPFGGPDNINRAKVKGLAKHIQEQFPHITVTPRSCKWQDAWISDKAIFLDATVIVSATADWPSDYFLNRTMLANKTFPSVIYGWIEPFALAAHALIIQRRGGCYECHRTPNGRFTQAAAELGQDVSGLAQAPGCGAFYAPYGPVDLAPAHQLVAAAALDVALGHVSRSEHRVWFSGSERLTAHNASWTNIWAEDAGEGRRELRRPYRKQVACQACQ